MFASADTVVLLTPGSAIRIEEVYCSSALLRASFFMSVLLGNGSKPHQRGCRQPRAGVDNADEGLLAPAPWGGGGHGATLFRSVPLLSGVHLGLFRHVTSRKDDVVRND